MLFGEFIRNKRLDLNLEAKIVSNRLGISPSYLVDIEKGRKTPPNEETLNKLAEILQLSKDETHEMLDLAAQSRNNAPHDITRYIMDSNMQEVRIALRTASEKQLGSNFWEKVNKMAKEQDDE